VELELTVISTDKMLHSATANLTSLEILTQSVPSKGQLNVTVVVLELNVFKKMDILLVSALWVPLETHMYPVSLLLDVAIIRPALQA
jgi:hypothetical protein